MLDLDTHLAQAAAAIDSIEARWEALAAARSHPRWAATGDLVLAGDTGTDPDGNPFTVLALDVYGNVTTLGPDDRICSANADPTCHTMTGRGAVSPEVLDRVDRAWQAQVTPPTR